MEKFSITRLIVTGLQELHPYTYLIADWLILFCLILTLLATYHTFHKHRNQFTAIVPSLLSGLGLFSIFFILFVELSIFNVQQIEKSLPTFLEGIRMAFVIGVVIVFCTSIIKIANRRLLAQEKVAHDGIHVTPKMIYLVLREISDYTGEQKTMLSSLVEQTREQRQHIQQVLQFQQTNSAQEVKLLEEIKHSLVGEKSLGSELQKLQATFLSQANNFPELEKLEEVIQGLVTVQNNYREETVHVHQQFSQSANSLNQFQQALQTVVDRSQAIPEVMQHANELVQNLHQRLQNVTHSLNDFELLHQKVGHDLPELESNFTQFLQGTQKEIQRNLNLVETALETQLDMAESSLEAQLEGFTALQKGFQTLEAETRSTVDQWVTDISETLQRFSGQIHQTTGALHFKPTKEVIEESLRTTQHLDDLDDDNEEILLNKSHNSGEIWQSRGYNLMESGSYEEAIRYFDKAIALKPKEFSLFYNKACCYALEGKAELAITTLHQAIHLNPECQEMAKNDSDFDYLRDHSKFQFLLRNGAVNGGFV